MSTYHTSEQPDSLGRTEFGYYPGITEETAFDHGRGCWRLGPKAHHEKFALIVGGGKGAGTVLAAVAIDHLAVDPGDPDRHHIVGTVLPAGHPVRDAYLGRPDPSGSASQNPIAYANLPEESAYDALCGCGCGEPVNRGRDYLPGHDHKAIHDRIKRHFGGSTLQFIRWIDEQGLPETAAGDTAHAECYALGLHDKSKAARAACRRGRAA